MNARHGLLPSHTLVQSHQRSMSFGLAPACPPDPQQPTRSAMAELLERNEMLWSHARPVMETLREQIAGTDSMVLLTDRHGTILHALGDDDFLARASQVALRPGISWSERERGTNAIGTALAEGDALQVHGGEHYLRANHVLTCACAPIHDPLGNIIGALDVSGDYRQPHRHTLALVRMSAQMVENHLFLNCYEHSIRLHFHARGEFVGTLVEGLASFSADGRFLSANRSGQFQLGLPLRALEAHTFTSLFGIGVADLLAHIRSQGQALLKLQMHNGASVRVRAHFDRPTALAALPPRQEEAAGPAQPGGGAAAQKARRPRSSPGGLEALLRTQEPQVAQAAARVRKVLGHQGISILIQGETGTGKELFAQAIHAESERGAGPFVALNCASIPETLIESELFGYEEGAFTGARRKGHPGKILQAHGGTLFLDEIGDMPLQMQGRLLRVLQEHLVTPLGGTRDIQVDIRILSATHRDLRDMIARGLFREDLYYRLNGLAVRMPALRERTDLSQLIDRLLAERIAEAGLGEIRIDPSVRAALLGHAWPGNFRQLNNVLRSATLMADGEACIRIEHLPEDFWADVHERPLWFALAAAPGMPPEVPAPPEPAGSNDAPAAEAPTLQQTTAGLVASTLARHGGNVSAAARALRVSRNTVYRYIRQSGRP